MSTDATTRTTAAYALADWDEIDDGTLVDDVAKVMRILAAAKMGKDVEDATVDGVRQNILDFAIRAERGEDAGKLPNPVDCQNDAELFCVARGCVGEDLDKVLACAERVKSRQLKALLEAYYALATYGDPMASMATQNRNPLCIPTFLGLKLYCKVTQPWLQGGVLIG
eukprot:gnl/Chilomastix_caulleri/1908.p1 GENE.gnl/Chilomastix_caulleri/1908~~gnl/Chilomastix_caulleri/1908.p1  ORF type:complete len:181 (-),score=37.01 gnl/Chilomastix_caulleri/1908:55-558(-)